MLDRPCCCQDGASGAPESGGPWQQKGGLGALNATITVSVRPKPNHPKTIGVMGSSGGALDPLVQAHCRQLGSAIARSGCSLITGACDGYPLAAAEGAKAAGGLVVGISPALSEDEHLVKYGSPTAYHDVIVYTGSGLMGREVTNIRSSDIVVIAGGRSGTLGEFAIAFDEGKLIGILEGSGGITELIPLIVKICAKDSGARILVDLDPDRLVQRLVAEYAAEHHQRPSVFHSPPSAAESTRSVAQR
ncbi:MAG: protein containing YHS domain protein [Cyanobacteria bacterium REEB65]|nr:protein containing YHS domain protein [Cyanobacteria bacterium REEB65]